MGRLMWITALLFKPGFLVNTGQEKLFSLVLFCFLRSSSNVSWSIGRNQTSGILDCVFFSQKDRGVTSCERSASHDALCRCNPLM